MEAVAEQSHVRIDELEAERKHDFGFCPVVESLRMVGNEKRLVIIRYLLDRPMRFSELLKVGLDSKTLSRALKSLEREGIVRREVISTRPFSVTYSLTEMGTQLKPVIDSLRAWAEEWLVPRMQKLQVIKKP